jgi:hypothetical protein
MTDEITGLQPVSVSANQGLPPWQVTESTADAYLQLMTKLLETTALILSELRTMNIYTSLISGIDPIHVDLSSLTELGIS